MGELTAFAAVSRPAVGVLLVLLTYCAHTQRSRGVILNAVTLPGMAAAALAAPLYADDWGDHLLAGAVVLVVLVAAAFVWPREIGMGAVKMAGVVAIVLGPVCWPAIAVGAAGSGAEIFVRSRRGRLTVVSPVPYVMAGVVLVAALGLAS